MSEMYDDDPIQIPPPPKPASSAAMQRLVVFSLLVILLFFGGIAAILITDPFDWNLMARLTGDFDATLEVMPADSTGYVGLNLLEANLTRLTEIRDVFVAATADSDMSLGEMAQDFNESLAQELDLSFSEDILPWLGQYVGLGLVSVDVGDTGIGDDLTVDWVAAAEIRNEEAADAFLAKLEAGWSEMHALTPTTATYQEVPLTVFTSDDREAQLVFGRSDGLVLIASSPQALHQAIDAQNGTSLADQADYTEVTAALPADRFVTAYINGTQLAQLQEEITAARTAQFGSDMTLPASPLGLSALEGIRSLAVGLSPTEVGIQIDSTLLYDPTQLSDLQKAMFNAQAQTPQTAAAAPEDTLVYMATGSQFNTFWTGIRQMYAQNLGLEEADFDESMALFAEQFGINPATDLIPYLDGEAALVVAPDSSGGMATMTQVNVGLAVLVGTSDEAALTASLDTFSNTIGDPQTGMGAVQKSSDAAGTFYHFESPLIPDLVLAYGVGQGYLQLGSSPAMLAGLGINESLSLADNRGYQTTQAAFAEGTTPSMYIDVSGLLATIRASDAVQAFEAESEFDNATSILRPIIYIAGTAQANENQVQQRLVIFLNE